MSDKYLARRAAVQIAFQGVDITSDIRPYLKSVTYTDNEEDKADDLQIKLHDRESIWLTKWLNDAINAAASPPSAETFSESEEAGTSSSSSYKVTARSGLNVRSGPGTSHSIYTTLPNGTIVEVVSIENGWATISYNGKTAYVSSAYIEAVPGSAVATAAVSSGGGTSTYKVTARSGLNVRSGPGTSYGKYGALVYGATIDVSSIENNWAVISYNGKTAYVSASYIELIAGASATAEASNSTAAEVSDSGNTGFKIQAVIVRQNWNGDGKDKVLECGQFEIDTVNVSGPPSDITLKSTSLPFSTQIRQTKKSRAWENIKLSGIVSKMAAAGGMAFLFLSASDPFYERVEQRDESDIAFLSALCHDAGISLKVTNNILVLFDQADYESKDAVLTITKDTKDYIKYKLNVGTADTQYDSCRVSYVDSSGKCIEATAKTEDYKEDSEDNQQLEITAKVSSTAEAMTLAEKMLRKHNKYARTATFTLPGNPDIVAGVTVILEGWGPWDGKYIVKQAKHTVGGSGYTTQITLRRVLEGY